MVSVWLVSFEGGAQLSEAGVPHQHQEALLRQGKSPAPPGRNRDGPFSMAYIRSNGTVLLGRPSTVRGRRLRAQPLLPGTCKFRVRVATSGGMAHPSREVGSVSWMRTFCIWIGTGLSPR